MHDKPVEPMRAGHVEEFDVWIFDSRDLVVSVVPLQDPWSATTENYPMNPSV